MGLFDWLKTETRARERRRPSPYEMASRIAERLEMRSQSSSPSGG
jgi:hypothetical protein